ncbi:MAG: PAS domain S-box protein, partial [Chloroflexota bacterium]
MPQPQPSTDEALVGLARLQRLLTTAAHPGAITDAVLAFMHEALQADGASLHLSAPAGVSGPGVSGLSGRSGVLEQGSGTLEAFSAGLVAAARQRLVIPDLNATSQESLSQPGETGAIWQLLREAGICALIAEPLTVRRHPCGSLAAVWTSPRSFDPSELLLLEIAGGQVAAAWDRLAAVADDGDVIQARLATIIEASEDAIIGKDLDGTIISWNPAAQRLYGYTASEVIGRPISMLIPADRPDEVPAILERLRRGERIEQYETTRVGKGNRLLDISISISPIKDSRGQIVGAASIARNITGRRQAERERDELLARERAAREHAEHAVYQMARLQLVTEALAGAMTMVEIAHAVIERGLPGVGAEAGSMRLLSEDGRSLDLVVGIGYPDQLIDEVQSIPVSSSSPIAVAVRTGIAAWREADNLDDARYSDFMRRTPDYPSGAALPLVVDGAVVGGIGLSFREPRVFSDEDRGFMLALAGQCSQAVHRVRLFERERAAREQLDAILGGVADGVVVQREDGSFVYANDAAARLSGFETAEEYLGAQTFTLSQQLSVRDADGNQFPYDELPARRAFRGETSPQMVVQFRHPGTGDLRWSRTQSRIIRGASGERLAISIFHDMTEERQSRERLRFLAEAGAQLAGSLDVEETLAELVRVASTTLADWAVVILTDEEGNVQHIATAHRDPEKTKLAGNLHERQLRHASGAKLLWQAIQTGETLLMNDISDELLESTARDAEHLALLRALSLSSLLYAPLIGR